MQYPFHDHAPRPVVAHGLEPIPVEARIIASADRRCDPAGTCRLRLQPDQILYDRHAMPGHRPKPARVKSEVPQMPGREAKGKGYAVPSVPRSEERRGGKEGGSTGNI